jgi:hypothetical protein
MPYSVFIESRISAAHRGEQTKFFGHQVTGDRFEETFFPIGDTFFEVSEVRELDERRCRDESRMVSTD